MTLVDKKSANPKCIMHYWHEKIRLIGFGSSTVVTKTKQKLVSAS